MTYQYSYDDLKSRIPEKVLELARDLSVGKRRSLADVESAFHQLTQIAPPEVWTSYAIVDEVARWKMAPGWGPVVAVFWQDYLHEYTPDFESMRPPALLYESTPEAMRGAEEDFSLSLILRYIYHEFDPQVTFYEELTGWLPSPGTYVFGARQSAKYLATRPDTLRYQDGVDDESVRKFAKYLYGVAVDSGVHPWKHGDAVLSMSDKVAVVDYILKFLMSFSDTRLPTFLWEDDEVRREWCEKRASSLWKFMDHRAVLWLAMRDPGEDVGSIQKLRDGRISELRWSSLVHLIQHFPDEDAKPILLGNALRNLEQVGVNGEQIEKGFLKWVYLPDWMFAVAQHPEYKLAAKAMGIYLSLYQVTV